MRPRPAGPGSCALTLAPCWTPPAAADLPPSTGDICGVHRDHSHDRDGVRPVRSRLLSVRPVRGVPVDAGRGAGLLQRELGLVRPDPLRGRAGGGARRGHVPQLRGHGHRRQPPGAGSAGVPRQHGQPPARPGPPGGAAVLPAAPHRSARGRHPRGGARPRRLVAGPRCGGPGRPGAGLAHALRRVLPPDGHAEPARQGPRGAGAARAAGALDPRAEGPGARDAAPDPGREGGHRRRPAVLHRSARGPPPLGARGPGHEVRAGRHRRGAVRGRDRSRRPRRSAA